MKIEIDKTDLLKSLEAIQITTNNRFSNAANGVLLEAKREKLYAKGNNYNIEAETFCEAKINEEGTVNIVAPQFLNTVKMMPEGTIYIEYNDEDKKLHLTCQKYKSSFPVRDYKQFPELKNITTIEKRTNMYVDRDDLVKAIKQISFATSTEKTRPMFMGINITVDQNSDEMAISATDTKQVARKTIKLLKPVEEKQNLIVPTEILREVTRQAEKIEKAETIQIIATPNHIAFIFGRVYLMTNLIAGTYPDINRIIPKDEISTVTTKLEDFKNAISFVNPISANDNFNSINMIFNEDSIEITAEDKTTGTAKTTIPCKNTTKKEVKVKCRAKYITDILRHSDGEEISLHLLENAPLRIEQDNDKEFIYVVAPLRSA